MQKAINYGLKNRKSIAKTGPLPSVIEAGVDETEKCFNIMFVRYDDERSLEVVESSVIDFSRVIEHLGQGNSVFIAPKRRESRQVTKKQTTNRHYINHV